MSQGILLLNPTHIRAFSVRIISSDQKISRIQWLEGQYRSRLTSEGRFACSWDQAVALDPTVNKKYLDWVLRLVVQEKLPTEDHYKVPTALNEFIRCQPMLKRDGLNLDINAYNSLPELFQALQPYEMKATSAELSRAERAEIDAQTEVILNSDELLVVSPKTKKASCFWGQGTKWCTAATGSGSKNAFSRYTDRMGKGLYIFIDKKNPGIKYQLSKSGEMANELDLLYKSSDEHIDRLFALSKGIHEGLDLAFVKFQSKFLASLNQSDDFCRKALKLNPLALEFISNKTDELVRCALLTSPRALQFVEKQTKEMCFKAVEEEGYTLKFVDLEPKMKWENWELRELFLKSIQNNPFAIQYVPEPTEEVCLAAVRRSGMTVRCITRPSKEVCIEAVRERPEALSAVLQQTPEICIEAVKKWPTALHYVLNYSPEIDLAAVRANGSSIALIPAERQTAEVCEQAIRNRPDVIKYVKHPTDALNRLAGELKTLRQQTRQQIQSSQNNSPPASDSFRNQINF